MRITRLRLRDLKVHRDLDLELAPGLTVVRGPNEAGKTTLQRALELALFRKVTAGGAEIDGLRSWGAPDDGRPWVALEFIQEDAGELGLRLPKGWDTPPVNRTLTNCHVCGRFTSMDRVTQRDQEEGWVVNGTWVTCSDECRAQVAKAQVAKSKSQGKKKSQKVKGK